MTAIQSIEVEVQNFIKQREQAIANVHAVEGAIQAAQFLLAKLKAEAEKAEAEGKKILGEVKAEAKTVVEKVEAAVEGEVKTAEVTVAADASKVETAVKDNVIAIDSVAKKV